MTDRDVLEFDILIVGAGPAGLAAALQLARLQRERGGASLSIAVLDKAREPGAHELSGAVLDLSSLRDLVADFEQRGAPVRCPVVSDDVRFLTARGQFRLPFTPPPLANHGHHIVSLNALVKWMARETEAAGIDLFSGFAAADVLYDGDRVVGVRTGDKGLDKQRGRKSNFEPGVDLHAKVTVFCDGVRGNLTKGLIRRFNLDAGRQPQVYALGIKELWELPTGRLAPGSVTHTMGYPLRSREFGGAFIYGLPDNLASVGFVSGLDYEDPRFDPHAVFQRFKQHPFVSKILGGGSLVRYGAKALPEGGWHAIPRLYMAGGLIAGDAAGLVNSLRLKGIHLAMRSGMLAANTAFEAVREGDVSESRLAAYARAVESGPIQRELYPVRNVHQAFEHGLLAGVAFSGLSLLTGGWWLRDPMPGRPGHERMRHLDEFEATQDTASSSPVKIDRVLTFDRVTGVHYSGTSHREDEPSHLLVRDTDICRTRCVAEYGNPCTRFCPANVYEMVDDARGGKQLKINASNCVHCKTCDIMDPYQIIDWVPPEGGEGPQYEGM